MSSISHIRQIFIKMENIITSLKSYQILTFPKGDNKITTKELLDRICEHYGFDSDEHRERIRLELWSGPIGSKQIQLDLCKYIPDKYDTIWVRGYVIDGNIISNINENNQYI